MELDVEIVDREFRQALLDYQKASGKEFPQVINDKAKDVAFRAIQFTPKARLNKLKKWEPGGTSYAGKLLHARATMGTRLGKAKKGEGNKPLAQKLYASRLNSRGYIAAGWLKAAQDLGGKSRSRLVKLKPGGRASKGGAKKATLNRLYADIFNVADGADIVGKDALVRAVDFVAKDMQVYIDRKLSPIAKKHSAR